MFVSFALHAAVVGVSAALQPPLFDFDSLVPGYVKSQPAHRFLNVVADFDGDGDQAALGVGPVMLVNDGEGVFTEDLTRIPPIRGASWVAAAIDIEGDGDHDLLMSTTGSQLVLMLNDGRGRFTEPPGAFANLGGSVAHLRVADLDADGDDVRSSSLIRTSSST